MSGLGTNGRRVLAAAAAVFLACGAAGAVTVVRQPYLQTGTPHGMTIVWRTVEPTDSRVRYGTVSGQLDQSVTVAGASTDHIVMLTGLSPGDRILRNPGSSLVDGQRVELAAPVATAAASAAK